MESPRGIILTSSALLDSPGIVAAMPTVVRPAIAVRLNRKRMFLSCVGYEELVKLIRTFLKPLDILARVGNRVQSGSSGKADAD